MEMRKSDYHILLITINNAWKHGNIGIDQLTGYLRKEGFNVDVAYFRTRDKVVDIYNSIKNNYAFYGFSVTSGNVSLCYELAKCIKNNQKQSTILFGGGYATRYYREMFSECAFVDYIILGDGENPTAFLLENLIENKQDVTNHYAITSPEDSKNKHQHINTTIDWMPAFDYYETDTFIRNSRKVHCIQTKNNICTGNCSFCTERHGKVHYKDISQIIEEIKHVHINYGVNKIFFSDDNIFDPNDERGKKHVRELCLELLKLKDEFNFKMVYQCYIKAISLRDIPEDNELLRLMKKVGFVEVFVGVESACQEDLNLYNKHTTVKDNYTIIKMLKRHGLFPILGFIAFNPYTTLNKMRENFEFLCGVGCTYLPNYLYAFVNINKYTEIYETARRDGLVEVDSNEYINIKYNYYDDSVVEILDYVEKEMLKKLKEIQYETDWIIYSYMEHQIIYDIDDLSEQLRHIKNEDLRVIKKYLSVLFVEHNLDKFKQLEGLFWKHFISQQSQIKNIYKYLLSKHDLSSCFHLYAQQLSKKNSFETRKCEDICIGECYNGNLICWFDKKSRIIRKNDTKIDEHYCNKTIVIVLESPHVAEYIGDYVSPALGTTGRNLGKHLHSVLSGVVSNDKYRIILMNSVQYQCSLGEKPGMYRDNMWLKLWFKEKMNNDFVKRLQSYKPDIIFNFCTKGDHSIERGLPKGCKSVINKKYIDYCIKPLSVLRDKTNLRQLVTEAIEDSKVEAVIYEADHPSAWRLSDKESDEDILNKIKFKKV